MTPALRALAAWRDQHVEFTEARRVLRESQDQFPVDFSTTWEKVEESSWEKEVSHFLFWKKTVVHTSRFVFTIRIERFNFGWSGSMSLNGTKELYFQYTGDGDRLKVDAKYHSAMLKAQPFLVEFFAPQTQKSPPTERPEGSEEPEGPRP